MTRRIVETEENYGTDSFLDVVANLVGIMIVLVMIAGLRVKDAATADMMAAAAATPAQDSNVERLQAEADGLESDILRAQEEIKVLDANSAAARQARDVLAFEAAARERVEAAKRDGVARAAQDTAQMEAELNVARGDEEALARELDAVSAAPTSAPVLVENYPTPISQTVFGQEAHFQLVGGRVTYIPLDELIAQFKQQARQRLYKLNDANEMVDTVGPIGGFRLRYTMEKVNVQVEGGGQVVTGGTFAQLAEYELLPVSSQMGETFEDAMRPHSQFRSMLSEHEPRQTTVTLWTYDDSFTMFHNLRKELHAQGFNVAGRPLRHGQPIGGSPHGTRSAAQ